MASAFLLDMSRCIGCEACVVACKAGNELPLDRQYIELIEQTSGTFPNLTGGFQNHRCYHCADATCVAVCPTGALFKEDGLDAVGSGRLFGLRLLCPVVPVRRPEDVRWALEQV